MGQHSDSSSAISQRSVNGGRSLTLGISGASGLIYAVRALKYLLEADYTVDVVASKATYRVWQNEMGIAMPPDPVKQAAFWRGPSGRSRRRHHYLPPLG